MSLRIKKFLKKMPALRDPVLIEGLPGIGNVGKVAVDFMIDRLKAKKVMEIYSHSFPHSVFVNEDNIVELPKIEVFYKKRGNGKKDILFLAGDIQPLDEESSYEFSYKVLDLFSEFKGRELITIGGIGLPDIPEKPKVYCTGTSKKIVGSYRNSKVKKDLFGVVGPIVGVTGLLIGLAPEKKMEGVCLLAETYGHPLYLGVKGSKEVLKIINKRLSLNIDVSSLSKEIEEIEEELTKKAKDINELMKPKKAKDRTNYIG